MQVSDIINIIEKTACPHYAAAWDKSGVQVPATRQEINFMAVMLDPTPAAISSALEQGANFILSHHPLSMKPRFVDKLDAYHRVLYLLLANQTWLYSAHTSLDASPHGPAFWLAEALRLQDTRVLEPGGLTPRLAFYTQLKKPERFAGGVADIKARLPQGLRFEQVADGQGIKISCPAPNWAEAKKVLLQMTPGAVFVPLENEAPEPLDHYGFGFIGNLPQAMPYTDFCRLLAEQGGIRRWEACGPAPRQVARVACCPGSGASMADEAAALGADVFITGDVKYHSALEAPLRIMDVGHFSLEEEMTRRFALQLAEQLPEIHVHFFSSHTPFAQEIF